MRFEQQQRAQHLREERLSRLLTEAELKALRTQVDPHFLFNTLNTIADLISTNPRQAEEMIQRLAECFRYALSRHSRDLSTLDDELEFARHYLGIEQVRFGDRLRVSLSRGDARRKRVPAFLAAAAAAGECHPPRAGTDARRRLHQRHRETRGRIPAPADR